MRVADRPNPSPEPRDNEDVEKTEDLEGFAGDSELDSEQPAGEKVEKPDTLLPIRVVERELTRPDGSKLRVEVPVYAAFDLEKRDAKPAPLARALRRRSPPRRKVEDG